METATATLTARLEDFFENWPKNLTIRNSRSSPASFPSTTALARFWEQLEQPLQSLHYATIGFNPWEAAGIGHNEVRNSALLAWLLDPRESHGFGRAPLHALLQLINAKRADFPLGYQRYCRIEVEKNPSGDSRNRVDIEIDTDAFFLLIEVKIRAGEQEEQMQRYCEEAAARAGARKWAVVFLTVHGGASLTAGPDALPEQVPAISWRRLSNALRAAVSAPYQDIISSQPVSPSRLMAACAALHFIDHIRKL